MSDDTERDANQALVELDKGLRSGTKGDQVEHVISLSSVFDKHPFPIFINSACLKLADCFHVSNNFVRLCIVRVLEESHKHLDKIQNLDEFVVRIFRVIHSNDPVARAVTIRCLASCAPILQDRSSVHHTVLEALNSNDEVEVQASLHAISEFSKVSKQFTTGALDVIADKIKTVPVPMKLELIQVLQYMDCSAAMISKTRNICMTLLEGYVAHDMVKVILSTMTSLCCRSLSYVNEQVELLLSWLNSDSRVSLQLSILDNLNKLLTSSPHHLTPQYVQTLVTYAESSGDNSSSKLSVLTTLYSVTSSLTTHCFNPSGDNSVVIQLIHSFAFDINLEVSARCLAVCSKLLVMLPSESLPNWKDDVISGVESLILTSVSQNDLTALKHGLLCMKQLAKLADGNQFIDVLITSLHASTDPACKRLLCEAFMTLELPPHIVFHDLLGILKDCKDDGQLLMMLTSVILHASLSTPVMGDTTLTTLCDVVMTQDNWVVYRVCRQSLRYGQYDLAARLLSHLVKQVASDTNSYYLHMLLEFCSAQQHLSKLRSESDKEMEEGDEEMDLGKLDSAIGSITQAIRYIQAVNCKSYNFQFHIRYLEFLALELSHHKQLHCVANMFWICPPPAIGKMESLRTGDDLVKYGRIGDELRRCSECFHDLYAAWTKLQMTLLDADTQSHSHIKLLMSRSLFIAQLIDTILIGERQYPLASTCEDMSAVHNIESLINEIKSTWPTTSCNNPEEEHDIIINSQLLDALKSASLSLMTEGRLLLPRYFFQRLQTTSVTINVTPHQKLTESVLVHNLTSLTLRVEGIISYKKPERHVRVKKVCVALTSQKQNTSEGNSKHFVASKSSALGTSDLTMESTINLSNNYFCTEFLLSFPETGMHNIKIVCHMVDGCDIKWDVDCRAELHVKSYKEKKHSMLMKNTI